MRLPIRLSFFTFILSSSICNSFSKLFSFVLFNNIIVFIHSFCLHLVLTLSLSRARAFSLSFSFYFFLFLALTFIFFSLSFAVLNFLSCVQSRLIYGTHALIVSSLLSPILTNWLVAINVTLLHSPSSAAQCYLFFLPPTPFSI